MFSLETRLAQSSEFKEELLHATSPLEFARGHIRQNGDVQNRSQAAHVGDRLKVVEDVLTSLIVRGMMAEQEEDRAETRRKRRREDEEEEERLGMRLTFSDGESEHDDSDDDVLMVAVADHYMSKAETNLRRLRLPRNYQRNPHTFDNTIGRYSDALCHKYFSLTQGELQQLFHAWDVPFIILTASRHKWTGEAAFILYMRYSSSTYSRLIP